MSEQLNPKEEIVTFLENGYIAYEYRCITDGKTFNWAGSSVEEAREACAQWLVAK